MLPLDWTIVLLSVTIYNYGTLGFEFQLGTWKQAMETCKMQLSVIESNVTILKQHYISSNSMEFWLPEATFKTSWIENLGCHEMTPYSQKPVYYKETLGDCHHLCQSKEISFFSYKKTECKCLPGFTNPPYRKGPDICDSVVFQTLTLVNIFDENKGNCVKTMCSNNGSHYKRGPLISVSCDGNYDINNVCVNANYFGNKISQKNASKNCIGNMSYLPGVSDSACSAIGRATDRGWKTAPMWSSIFRREYSKQFYKKDHQLRTSPVSCKYRKFNHDSRESGEIYRDCNEILTFACEQSGRSPMTKDVLTNSKSKVSEATGLAVGIALGIFIITIVVAVFVILKRKWKCNPVIISSHTADCNTSNIQFTSEPEISHVRGIITSDEYAVVNKSAKVHIDTSNRNIDGLYTTPYTEYDRLAHGRNTHSKQLQNTYDTVNGEHVISMYHTASSKLRISDNLEHYDHIPTDC